MVYMYVDFYISAVSAWTVTTPGVTWDLDKQRHPTLVSADWNPHDQISLLHRLSLHKLIHLERACDCTVNSEPCRRGSYQRSILETE
jgi:hypothetical protein